MRCPPITQADIDQMNANVAAANRDRNELIATHGPDFVRRKVEKALMHLDHSKSMRFAHNPEGAESLLGLARIELLDILGIDGREG